MTTSIVILTALIACVLASPTHKNTQPGYGEPQQVKCPPHQPGCGKSYPEPAPNYKSTPACPSNKPCASDKPQSCSSEYFGLNGECGPKSEGNFRCRNGYSCSQWGSCGTGPHYANPAAVCPAETRPDPEVRLYGLEGKPRSYWEALNAHTHYKGTPAPASYDARPQTYAPLKKPHHEESAVGRPCPPSSKETQCNTNAPESSCQTSSCEKDCKQGERKSKKFWFFGKKDKKCESCPTQKCNNSQGNC